MPQSLSRSPLLLEFKRILAERDSGTLTVSGEGFQKRLVFARGDLVAAESSLPEEGLTAILQDSGLISGDVIMEDDDMFARLLVTRGILQPGEVNFARMHRLRIIALSLCSAARGDWSFRFHSPPESGETQGRVHLADILSDAVSATDSHYYFREIFSRSQPEFISPPRGVAARVYERQLSLFTRMRRLKARSHERIRQIMQIDEQDYWEILILFYLLGGVRFAGSDTSDAIKQRREMVIRWRDRMQSGQLDPHELLGLRRDAPAVEVEAAFRKQIRDFHPRRLDLSPDAELYPIAMEITRQMQNARDTLLHPTAETRPPAAAPEKEKEEENPVKRAQVLFQEALELKGRTAWGEAAACLQTAVRLDPERAKYFFQLGVCQMHMPAFRKQAEENLMKAAEMEPWNAEPAYTLGVMFRSAGLRRMSEKYFRMALEINMDHTKAGRALRELTGAEPQRSRRSRRSS